MQLIMFPGDAAMPSLSPFCMKAICLLEMAGQNWQPEISVDVSTAPLRKLPVLRVGDQLIPDSSNIEDYLAAQGTDFYPGLNEVEIGEAHALKSMVEHSLVLGMVHDRWLDHRVWPQIRDMFFAEVPAEARDMVAAEAQAPVRAGLESQGIARFSPEDRLKRMERDLAAIETKLGDKAFLFGDVATAADATVAPVLDMILRLPGQTELQAAVADKPTLVSYVDRVRAAIYPKAAAAPSAAAE